MVDQNCAYCVEGELLAKFGIKICELENSKVYLFKRYSSSKINRSYLIFTISPS